MAIPKIIEELAHKIRTAIYGKDVRESLASGIEKAGEIAEDARKKSDETDSRQTELETRFEQQIQNMTLEDPSSAEIVDARGGETLLRHRLEKVDAQLAQTVKVIQNENQLISAINEGVPLTLNIGKGIDITSNLTIPTNIRLVFDNGGFFNISSGVTLTIDGYIDAGYYQIFKFTDSTSKVVPSTLKNPYYEQNETTKIHYNVRLDWFGASPYAIAPHDINVNAESLPSGTDSSDAFRRALLFAGRASLRFNGYVEFRSKITVEATPNGIYYVKGDNLLGVQEDLPGYGAFINFKGNGCTILHEVLDNSDALINNGYALHNPHYYDFHVYVFNGNPLTKRIGKFFSTGKDVPGNPLLHPLFRDISVCRIGIPTPKGYDIIFDIDGTNMEDNGVVERFQAAKFNKFFYCNNGQAVTWKFIKPRLSSGTDNSVLFHFNLPQDSMHFDVDGAEINISTNDTTILKTEGEGSYLSIANFKNCRLETNGVTSDDFFTLFDMKFGRLYVEGLSAQFGNNNKLNPATKLGKFGIRASAKFYRCLLPENVAVTLNSKTITPLYPPFRNQVIFDECLFWRNDSTDGENYPTIKWLDENEAELTTYSAIKKGYTLPNVQVLNPAKGMNYGILDFETGDYITRPKTIIVSMPAENLINQNGDRYLNGTMGLPNEIVITSIKIWLYDIPSTLNEGDVNFVRANITNRAGSGEYLYKSLTGVNKLEAVELIPDGHVISCPKSLIGFSYLHYDGTTYQTVSDQNKWYRGWAEITYRGVNSTRDYYSTDPTATKLVPL